MDIDVDTSGFEDAIEELKDIEDDLSGGGTWVVGHNLEFGTINMLA